MKDKRGFTLLEVIMVVAIIGALAAIVVTVINPTKQLAMSRNAQRRSDVVSLHDALVQYAIDTGTFPAGITDESQEVCKEWQSGDCVSLDALVLNQEYLAGIPSDPSSGSETSTGYSIRFSSSSGRSVVVIATLEDGQGLFSKQPLLSSSWSGWGGWGAAFCVTITDGSYSSYAGDYSDTGSNDNQGDDIYSNGTRYWSHCNGSSYFTANLTNAQSCSSAIAYGDTNADLSTTNETVYRTSDANQIGTSATWEC